MEDIIDSEEVILELDENGFDSLSHAIDHFLDNEHPNYMKYSVLHSFHAAELLLKHKLALIDRTLIYKNPNGRHDDNAQTIGLDKALELLKEKGVEISPADESDLKSLKRIRNRIEHRRFVADPGEVRDVLGQSMRFLDHFSNSNLQVDLRGHLDPQIYETFCELILDYEEALSRAHQTVTEIYESKRRMDEWCEIIECPECSNQTIVVSSDHSDHSMLRCHAPGCHLLVNLIVCERCGQFGAVVGVPEYDDVYICESCTEYWMSNNS